MHVDPFRHFFSVLNSDSQLNLARLYIQSNGKFSSWCQKPGSRVFLRFFDMKMAKFPENQRILWLIEIEN